MDWKKKAESSLECRSGSVLTRHTVLKIDHFHTGIDNTLDYKIQGAPNFRKTDLNIYGVAQPTSVGLSTMLNLLDCNPEGRSSCHWFMTREEPLIYINDRPFVLREESSPFVNIQSYSGISSYRLERMEERLKEDVLAEASQCNGLIIIHDEKEPGKLYPCLIAADNVLTPREVFESFMEKEYRVRYYRIPVSPEQSPAEDLMDFVVDVIQKVNIDEPLIFNCGMGIGRTTHAMIIGLLIKRAKLIESGSKDPFTINLQASRPSSSRRDILRLVYILEKGLESKMSPRSAIEWALERGELMDDLEKAIIGDYHIINRLGSLLEDGPTSKRILDEAIDKCDSIINVRETILMHLVRFSIKCTPSVLQTAVTFLERYFSLYAFSAFLESRRCTPLGCYWEGSHCFSDWMKERPEIWGMLQFLRKKGPRLPLFRPVDDLSKLAQKRKLEIDSNESGSGGMEGGNVIELNITKSRSGTVLGPYTILKIDRWYSEKQVMSRPMLSRAESLDLSHLTLCIPGAIHFRQMIDRIPVFGVAQPNLSGMLAIFPLIIKKMMKENDEKLILWINLREEPIVYIQGEPFVLRDHFATLRNIKSYTGISGPRLESLEERLVDDISAEINLYQGKLLLHEESEEGNVIAKWHTINHKTDMTDPDLLSELNLHEMNLSKRSSSVEDFTPVDLTPTELEAKSIELLEKTPALTLRQLYERIIGKYWKSIRYYRVPITSEEAPEFEDFDSLMRIICSKAPRPVSVILNCQIGLGRSAVGMVIASMIIKWLDPKNKDLIRQNSLLQIPTSTPKSSINMSSDYEVIRSLLRVIRYGLEAKKMTDELIDGASVVQPFQRVASLSPFPNENSKSSNVSRNSQLKYEDEKFFNLRLSIEAYRKKAENTTDTILRQRAIRKGLQHLKRYFLLIAFQSYLLQSDPSPILSQNRNSSTLSDFSLSLNSTSPPPYVFVLETFSSWMNRHPELIHMIQTQLDGPSSIDTLLPESSSEFLQSPSPVGDDIKIGSTDLNTLSIVLRRRQGSVLAPNMILKEDHFPGCQFPFLAEKCEGAPNIRRVALIKSNLSPFNNLKSLSNISLEKLCYKGPLPDMKTSDDMLFSLPTSSSDLHFIYGLAIPRYDALTKALTALGFLSPTSRSLLWTSLREEPLLYINKGPFVLRSVASPWSNLETTGIARERVEWMEDRLKKDLLREVKKYSGQVLLHDEVIENKQALLKPIWTKVDANENILTPSDVFLNIVQEGFRVNYYRLPITDEQAPIPQVFDTFRERYWNLQSDEDAIFNCQMGRGRTTTGMVISCMIQIIIRGSVFVPSLCSTKRSTNLDKIPEKFKGGEYRIILQLIKVLEYGRLSKNVADICIDMCDHLQNLREAIYDFKVKVDVPSKLTDSNGQLIFQRGVNYLIRYFYLIVFANYLIDLKTFLSSETEFPQSFSSWLQNRKEILSLASSSSVDFS